MSESSVSKGLTKRDLFGGFASAIGAGVALSGTPARAEATESNSVRYGMVIHLRRCIGCDSCTVACKQENGVGPGVLLSEVIKEETGEYPRARLNFLPVLCNHCEDPPCVKVCPVTATYKRLDGIVVVDSDKCIGCRYCIAACPYHARRMTPSVTKGYFPHKGLTPYEKNKYAELQVGTTQKCDFCASRIAEDKPPACVQSCPGRARIFGDLNNPESEASKLIARHAVHLLKPEKGTGPSVYYIT